MTQVKSTYNFVPAPEESEVFKPSWAEQVSHDIPFSDGESGEIEIEITAETPIFIRNGHSKGNETNEFSHVEINGEKKYFIPATSLKGMTRNVLEILSFSRLNKKLVNDDRYSFRDLTRDSEYMKSYDTNKVKAGWLSEDTEGNWIINECNFNHIHHSEVDAILGTNFRKDYLGKQPLKKSAEAKYEICKGIPLTSTFGLKASKSKPKGLAIFQSEGKKGTIVFTGQSGPRKENKDGRPSGKVHEFVFYDGIVSTIKLTDKQVNDFKFIYLDHDKNNISPDWKYWKSKLKEGGKMPVFFNKLGDNKVKHFGLSYMYKLPYENSVHEMFPFTEEKGQTDLATLIFGFSEKNDGLKGRVYFGNAFAVQAKPITKRRDILGGPKASFTPFYLQQTNPAKVLTFQETGTLKGYKKYPVHNDVKQVIYSEDQLKNQKVFTEYIPLDKGSTFVAKIKYHNLKKIELGAIISALTFHNNSSNFLHTLGGAKPLGLGSVKLKVLNIEYFIDALQHFEYTLNLHTRNKLGVKWLESRQVVELLAISSKPISKEVEENLVYPSIGKEGKNGNLDNEFIQIKTNKSFLSNYSKYNGVFSIKSLISAELLNEWELIRQENDKKIAALKKEKQEQFDRLIYKAKEALMNYEFEIASEHYKAAMELNDDNTWGDFQENIESKKKEKEELDAYHCVVNSNDKSSLEEFINKYPLSKFKAEIENKIKLKEAVSGIPSNIKDKMNLKQFGNNTDNWVKKIVRENKTIKSLGFEEEHINQLFQIFELEKGNSKLLKEWAKYQKSFINWYGEEKANEILNKITN